MLDQAFLVTTNGGRTWKPVPGITDVTGVLTLGDSIWVVGQPGTTASAYGDTVIWTSANAGKTWSSPVTSPDFDLSRIGGSSAYALSPQDQVVLTTDEGATWTPTGGKLPVSCPSGTSDFAAGGVGDLWYLCGAVGGGGMQEKALYRSSDAGKTWETLRSITSAGYPDDLAVLSPTEAFLSLDRQGLVETSDAGREWPYAINVVAQVTYFSMYSKTGGVALLDGNAFHTADGVHWYPTN